MREIQLEFIVNEKNEFEIRDLEYGLSPRPKANHWPTEEELCALAAKEPLVPLRGGIRIPRGGYWKMNIGGPGRSYVLPRIK